MLLSVVVILFVALLAFWWAQQGMFGALLHLALTIVAGVIAFALWEPLAYGFFLEWFPEAAWAAALMLPFGLSLWLLRIAFDKLVIGNVYFNPNLDRLLGGLLGALSGILTTGLCVIGLQMSGMPSLLGHRICALDAAGAVVRQSPLILPVDSLAADFFSALAAGPFAPILADSSLASIHPDLAAQASLHHQSVDTGSRRAIRPSVVSVMSDSVLKLAEIPPKLAESVKPAKSAPHLAVVGVRVVTKNSQGTGAADDDGIYRAARNQVALAYARKGASATELAYPLGYIQNGQFATLLGKGDFAYSAGGAAEALHHFLFPVPSDAEFRFIRVKGVRLDLKTPSGDAANLAKLLTYDASAAADVGASSSSSNVDYLRVSDLLPHPANSNLLSGVKLSDDKKAVASGKASVESDPTLLGNRLAVMRVFAPASARIVQLDLGDADQPESLLSRIRAAAKPDSKAPALFDAGGAAYHAVGFSFVGKSVYRFNVDQSRSIQALADLGLQELRPGEKLVLYYQVAPNTTLTALDLGDGSKQPVQVVVK
jgi:hypothetical protein